MRRIAIVPFLLLALVSAACGEEEFTEIAPKLEVRPDTAKDPADAARWFVDFGEVVVGQEMGRSVYVTNKGNTVLTVFAPGIEAPFAHRIDGPRRLEPNAELEVLFTFKPTRAGPAEALVTIPSDGGEAVVRLVGTAVAATPDDCEFEIEPAALDFGNVPRSTSKALDFRVKNVGSAPCEVRRLSLMADGDAAFTLPDGAIASETIPGHTELSVFVTFTPDRYAPRFTTKVQFWVGPPERVAEVQVTGASAEPCPGALPDGTCPVATESVYVNVANTLYSTDPTSLTKRPVGTFKENGRTVSGITDIAIDTNGTMLGVADTKLYVINPTTGAVQSLATLSTRAPGLTFLPDGRLVASGDRVIVVDRSSGRTLDTLVPAGRFVTSGDIIGLPDGMLYWTVQGGTRDKLVRIDPNARTTTVVGTLSIAGVYGLGYANGKLYGYTDNGRIVTIDPGTAQVTENRKFDGSWWGATTNPVRW